MAWVNLTLRWPLLVENFTIHTGDDRNNRATGDDWGCGWHGTSLGDGWSPRKPERPDGDGWSSGWSNGGGGTR